MSFLEFVMYHAAAAWLGPWAVYGSVALYARLVKSATYEGE